MSFSCSQCGHRYRANPGLTGRRVECKVCNGSFIVPVHADTESHADALPPRPRNDPSPHDRSPNDRSPNDRSRLEDANTTDEYDDQFSAGAANLGSAAATMRGGGDDGRHHTADVIDYEIFGGESQYVEITLDPGEQTIAEAGALMFMTDGIEMNTVFGNPSQTGGGLLGKVVSAGKRALTGESLFMTTFTNRGAGRSVVAFGSPFPGRMIPLHLDQLGGEVICQKDAFLCGARGIDVGIAFQKKIGAGLFGGEGFILQRLRGDGIAIVHAGGSMMYRELHPGERLRVDTGCLMAMGPTVNYDIEFVGGLKNAFFGGEGLFMATLVGPGPVWLQSLPFSRLAGRMQAMAGGGGGGVAAGEGSLLGGLGEMFMGD